MSDMKPLSVLIVDDEKTNLDVLSHILSEDYEVYIAKSGKTALKQAVTYRPDLILLDIVMPEMNGYEMLALLNENESTARIPVMFITGLNSIANEEKGLHLGAVDYITKPFSPTIVKARVRSHIKIARQIRTIEELGMIDFPTGLPNRKCFDLQCRIEWLRAIRKKTSLSLQLIDVVGSETDDKLIRKIVPFLKETRETCPTGFLARIEKTRFGLLLIDIGLVETSTLRNEIRSKIRSGFLFPDTAVCVGIASVNPNSEWNLNDLYTQAEQSLQVERSAVP